MKKMNNILKMISKMESNANEVKLGTHEIELSGIADKALKTLDSFRDNQLQNTVDLKNQLDEQIKKYNKKVDDTTKKFREIEKGEYLTAYTKITDMARELGVAPAEVPQLLDLQKKYFANDQWTRDLQKIIVTQ
jgi:predicted nuclease with TOPRIM domain